MGAMAQGLFASLLIGTIFKALGMINSGKTVVNNSKGSNMAPGLASALVTQCTLSGKVTADVAVLEVDERSSQYIYTQFTPDFILCTNLFRDSIMRNGHSGFIFDKINERLICD